MVLWKNIMVLKCIEWMNEQITNWINMNERTDFEFKCLFHFGMRNLCNDTSWNYIAQLRKLAAWAIYEMYWPYVQRRYGYHCSTCSVRSSFNVKVCVWSERPCRTVRCLCLLRAHSCGLDWWSGVSVILLCVGGRKGRRWCEGAMSPPELS